MLRENAPVLSAQEAQPKLEFLCSIGTQARVHCSIHEFDVPQYAPRIIYSATVGETSPLRFYEKVIKVKADVAALLILFFPTRAPFFGVHLDP
jgi:hypothetical protein